MEDDTSNDTLDYDETKAAIPSLGFIDVVGYDGCNMASLEIMDLWHGHATAMTGSQEWVGCDGLEYDTFLRQLKTTPTMSADQLAINSSASTVTDKTWSAVAVDSRMNPLVTAVDQWSVGLTNGLAANKKAYSSAFGATRSYATSATLRVGISHVRPVLPERPEQLTSLLADWDDAPTAYAAHTTKLVLHRPPLALDKG